ncbi:hypothetical protein [Ideonella margarita]|uniref:Uncharacterized protein n=1 Tax=Ideonella margarita TaxID=2984191 RepID=A0ABU9C1Q5_9BURK
MSDYLPTLEEAISDVGYWRWWADALPDIFQVEFGGVQLHFPPHSPNHPPNSVVALRFFEPSVVAFLTEQDAQHATQDWRHALHEDKVEPFSVNHELFTLTSEDVLREVVSGCRIEYAYGSDIGTATEETPVLLAFRAQEVGFVVRARRMVVVAQPGELDSAQIVAAAGDWWEYWREYWRRRETDAPLPKDYACEVTIPIK